MRGVLIKVTVSLGRVVCACDQPQHIGDRSRRIMMLRPAWAI